MQSLREQLNQLIKLRGMVAWTEIKDKCESGYFGRMYKASNMERRLRSSESPDVEAIMKDGHIGWYKWVGAKPQQVVYRVLDDKGRVEKVLTYQKT